MMKQAVRFSHVNQEKSLKFYCGTASGPVLADFDYHSQKGARAAQIEFGETTAKLYFNGGCTFLNLEKPPNLKILGYYLLEDKIKTPAIIYIKQGKGYVILSGVHFEFEPSTMDETDPCLSYIIPEIKSTNSQRLALTKQLLNMLNLEVQP